MKLEKQKLFWSKTRPRRNGCIEWLAGKTLKGYGQFYFNKRTYKTHRLSWILTNGEIPEGLMVLHKCDNPSCVNPDHLYLGTNQYNMNDKVSRGRSNISTETKLKMSKSRMGRIVSEETRLKISNAHKGRVATEETKRKLSESHKGKKPWNKGLKGISEETRLKMSESLKGRIVTEETRYKISEANKGIDPKTRWKTNIRKELGL